MNINPLRHPAFLAVALSAAAICFVEPRLVSVGAGPPPHPGSVAAQAGHGVILATLGGWRALTADFIWLKANLAW
ncbi:MAG: hypothetical protein HY302_01715, partial [Opitutae bacterium]|nr:hypothetical protein [Opitutae bacterium]